MLLLGTPGLELMGGGTAAIGAVSMYATSWIYLVPCRPAWSSPLTIADFFLTGLTLCPLLLPEVGAQNGRSPLVAAPGLWSATFTLGLGAS